MKKLAIIILTYNTYQLTRQCVKSLLGKINTNYMDIIVVDNNSTDNTSKKLKKHFPSIKIINNKKNLGFSAGNNVALKKYAKSYNLFLLLNSDTIVKNDSIGKMIEFMQNSQYAILSGRLLNIDGGLQSNAGLLPKPFNLAIWLFGLDDIASKLFRLPSYQERHRLYYEKSHEVGWVSGTAMLIKAEVFNRIGYLDEKIFMYGEDVDYCWRANNANYKIGWYDGTEIIHFQGGSIKSPKYTQWLGEFTGLIYLYQKNYGLFASRILRKAIKIALVLRIVAFFFLGKQEYVKTYQNIFRKI